MSADTLVVLATLASHGDATTRALKELRASTQMHYALCLVVDDVPAPGGPELPRGWWDGGFGAEETLLVLAAHRRGLVHAYNDGFTRFRGFVRYDYLHLLEDGVRHTGGALDRMRRTLEAHPQMGWVGCGQIENSSAPFTALCSLMTRACAERVRGLDPIFSPCQMDDGDLWMRVCAAGFRPHAIANKVSHPQSRTSREGTEAEDIQLMLAHREVFRARWNVADMAWADVPVHQPCGSCR